LTGMPAREGRDARGDVGRVVEKPLLTGVQSENAPRLQTKSITAYDWSSVKEKMTIFLIENSEIRSCHDWPNYLINRGKIRHN
jgi:hypothetical protein